MKKDERPTPLEIIINMRKKNFREDVILEEVEKELFRLEAGRSKGQESEEAKDRRVKELEEILENNNGVLKSIVDDLPKEGLGLIFVKQQIASNNKYLENNF